MAHNMCTMIDTRTIRQGKICQCLALGTAMMGVASNHLCRRLSTIFSKIKIGGILRPTLVSFGLQFSWARRKLFLLKIQKTSQGTSLYFNFWKI